MTAGFVAHFSKSPFSSLRKVHRTRQRTRQPRKGASCCCASMLQPKTASRSCTVRARSSIRSAFFISLR